MPSAKRAVGSPTKRLFIDALTSDLDLADAVSDLVDNSVDAARRFRPHSYDGLTVHINFDASEFSISDNCGGIDLDTAEHALFSLGRPDSYKATPGQIGRFGIGMKRDLFMMGTDITVESSTPTSYFKIKINLEEWVKAKDWDFDFTEYKANIKIPPNEVGTKITVKKIRDEISREFAMPSFNENLIAILQKRQKQALQDKLAIFVGSTRLVWQPYRLKYLRGHIEPGYFVRKYNGRASDPLTVKIVAGVDESKPREAGWYVSCNGRFILVADQSPKTGWGESGNVSLPKMHQQFSRFRGYVFFECEDPVRLPWNSTKTGLNTDSSVYREIRALMIASARPVIDFLNELDAESEMDQRPLTLALEQADAPTATALLDSLEEGKNFVFKGLKGDMDPERPIRISYTKPLGQVQRVRKKLGVETNKEVGIQTFDYYCDHELRKRI